MQDLVGYYGCDKEEAWCKSSGNIFPGPVPNIQTVYSIEYIHTQL